MAKARRIFELAKELGVPSKAIVEKCKAESVPDINNHMSTVKLGLEATIREWFGDAQEDHSGGTAVETAKRVDVSKVKATRAKSKPKAADEGDQHNVDADANKEAPTEAVAASPPPDDQTAVDADAPATAAAAAADDHAADDTADHTAEHRKARARARKAEPQPEPAADESENVADAETTSAATATAADSVPQPDHTASTDAAAPPDLDTDAKATSVDTTTSDASTTGDDAGDSSTSSATATLEPQQESGETVQVDASGDDDTAGDADVTGTTDADASAIGPKGIQNVPNRPDVIKPVGEQLVKPTEAKLKGPRVIRVEKADEMPPLRGRRPGGPPSGPRAGGGGGGPSGGGGAGNNTGDVVPGVSRSRGPVRGRGAGGAGAPADDGRKPRRSQNTRRGRSADALSGARGKMSEQDLIELDARLKGAPGFVRKRRRDLKGRGVHGQAAMTPLEAGGKVEIQEPITIKKLSAQTGIKSADIMKRLFQQGVMATINSAIDSEMAMEIALEYDLELVVKEMESAEQLIVKEFESREVVDLRKRPPVVTVLGHVDHGKTSLLDRIRKADVAAHEYGGITQHVGAYRVTIDGAEGEEKTVVFLDTPGHEAFTSMRARGAKVTDMIVLVVAADDGMMPQTIESINHAKAAGVPIIVALNKIDLPQANEANLQKLYGQLAEHGLNPVEWGGETEVMKVSATRGDGITELVEMLDFQAEVLDLKADYGGPAKGTVIEAEMQEGRGSVARVLVNDGTLRVGDFIVIGRAFGRVREMTDDRSQQIREASPATPLELSGIDQIPDAGDSFYICSSLRQAEEIAHQYRDAERQKQLASKTKVTMDNFAETIQAGETTHLRVVLKADVQGSIDVLRKTLAEQGNTEVAVRILHAAVGGVTESDVLLADASDAIILGFHVVMPSVVRDIADQHHVDVRLYNVIYDLNEDVKKALEGMLTPEVKETQLGMAEVREVFNISKIGKIAGCVVQEGVVERGAHVRVVRDDVVVTKEGRTIETLRRVKDEAREVRAGTECGIRVTGFDDLKAGDKLVCFRSESVARTLE